MNSETPVLISRNHSNCNSHKILHCVPSNMAIEIYDLSYSSCRHTYMHTNASCLTLSCITSGNLWLFFGGGLEKERMQMSADSWCLPGGEEWWRAWRPHSSAPHLASSFQTKTHREKVGRLLQQRDQMVQKVKSTAHSVSTTLLVTWAMLLMPLWPTGVRWVWTASPSNWHHVWAWEEVLPVNLTHTCVYWMLRHNGCCHLLHLRHLYISECSKWTVNNQMQTDIILCIQSFQQSLQDCQVMKTIICWCTDVYSLSK